MGPEYFWMSGMWIFPIIMIVVMVVVIYLIFGRGNFRYPWYGTLKRRLSQPPKKGGDKPVSAFLSRIDYAISN